MPLFALLRIDSYKFQSDTSDEDGGVSVTRAGSKRNAQAASLAIPASRRPPSGVRQSLLPASSRVSSSRVLFSAYKPSLPPKSRNPPMVEHSFIRTHARCGEDGQVSFRPGSENEKIQVARDWLVGMQKYKRNEPYLDTGFVGEGYSKRAIYVSDGCALYPPALTE